VNDTEELLAADYFLGVLGLGIMRTCLRQPSAATPRRLEMAGIVSSPDEFPNSLRIPFSTRDVESGYTTWAPIYDAPGNPVVAAEQPVVQSLLESAPRGRALDAACGTGRHAAYLAALGYDVIGVDATAAMLDVARANTAGIDLRLGTMESLPVDDESIDVVTCALALEHVDDLGVVMQEFARVLRPGGWLVCSDTHPIMRTLGVGAFVPSGGLANALTLVRGHTQHVHDYLDAFAAAGLVLGRCIEPPLTDEVAATFPTYALYPEATLQAWAGLPYLLVWQVTKG
jgi:ubiquinone/menaquinone biosynthesis C-methylase UbiE